MVVRGGSHLCGSVATDVIMWLTGSSRETLVRRNIFGLMRQRVLFLREELLDVMCLVMQKLMHVLGRASMILIRLGLVLLTLDLMNMRGSLHFFDLSGCANLKETTI